MAIISREKLKLKFKNGLFPTQDDFANLIDSALNKRDDHFFGKWQEGRKYCEEDVVIYDKALYILRLLEEAENDCGSDTTTEEDSTVIPAKDNNCYCSIIPPNRDGNWCLLELKVNDDDWEIVQDRPEDPKFMYAKVNGNVGIGSKKPSAKLDISNGKNGQFLFDPNDNGNPSFIINRLEQDSEDDPATTTGYLKNSINQEHSTWLTNAPLGYVFKIEGETLQMDTRSVQNQEPTDDSQAMTLMLITNDDSKNHTRIGIGTDDPTASLDIKTSDKAQVQIHTDGNIAPQIQLFDLDGAKENYLSISLKEAYATFLTDSEKGFRFKKAPKTDEKEEHSDTLLSISKNGKVGIGTPNPMAQLQVTDGDKGDFRMSLRYPNPTFSIINLKNSQEVNYLVTGVDTDQAKFVTDAESGFVFLAGEECGEDKNEENINQGTELLRIQADIKNKRGKETRLTPTLDIKGISKNYGNYVAAEKKEYTKTRSRVYNKVLDKLSNIKPIAFKWNEKNTRIGDIGEQLGLDADELLSDFPQVVMKEMDTSKNIAYERMIPILIQAINDLRAEVEELKKKK